MKKLLYGLDIYKAFDEGLTMLENDKYNLDDEPNRLLEYLYYGREGYIVGQWDELFSELDGLEFLKLQRLAIDELACDCKDLNNMNNTIAYILAIIGLANDGIAERIEGHYIC